MKKFTKDRGGREREIISKVRSYGSSQSLLVIAGEISRNKPHTTLKIVANVDYAFG